MNEKEEGYSIIVDDKSTDISIEKVYPNVESFSIYSMNLDNFENWRYYRYSGASVFGLIWENSQNTLRVVKFPCTAQKYITDFMITQKTVIPVIDKQYPEWRRSGLFVFDYTRTKTLCPEDFFMSQPSTFGQGDSIILAKSDKNTGRAITDKVFFIYARDGESKQTFYSLLALARLYFSQYLAKPQYPPKTFATPTGKQLVYNSILEFFKNKRGYTTFSLRDIDFETLSPFNSPFQEPLYASKFNTKKLDDISFNVRKSLMKESEVIGKVSDSNEEEISLSELMGMGIDSVLVDIDEGAKPLNILVDQLVETIKSAKLRKNALEIEVYQNKVDVEMLKSALDTENLTIKYPDGTIEPMSELDDEWFSGTEGGLYPRRDMLL